MALRREDRLLSPLLSLDKVLALMLVVGRLAEATVHAGCQCVLFDSTFGKEFGVFTSPNWPAPYGDQLDCLLYSFLAPAGHIVEITFDEFDVQRGKSAECYQGDYVRLYLHVDTGVDESSDSNGDLCGRVADIDQTHFSSGTVLVFLFHTDWHRAGANHTGFRGTFRFLDKRQFETDGEHMAGSTCDFLFAGGNLTKGKFFSPNYPSPYPRDVRCTYRFLGKATDRVSVVFESLSLQRGDNSCLSTPAGIVVYDGRDASCPVIGQLCNEQRFVTVAGSGPDLTVEFWARGPARPGQGFKASFIFEEDPRTPSTEPEKSPTFRGQRKQGLHYPASRCVYNFTSDVTQSGNLSSPTTSMGDYTPNTHCIYKFSGRGRERVQISFTYFNLYMPEDAGRECENVDAVVVFIEINGQKERVDNFCGQKLPAQLMSNGQTMYMEFRSHGAPPPGTPTTNLGFRAIFKFVTDFGITSGVQADHLVCGFYYNSTDRSNGTFTSPNYPGIYPRSTECYYFFHGQQHERVHITFAYFDVEGVSPCTTETASDYVEFSNFRTVDRKIPRHCGLKKPKVILSDSDYFRITFKSNDRFDGTGFEAFYQFRNAVDISTNIKRLRSAAQDITGSLGVQLAILLLLFLL